MTTESMSMRERTRRAVQDEIGDVAMGLFLAESFDTVTVERIATEVGISSRTFFRHFGTKEDVVLRHLVGYGVVLRRALEARPDRETAWEALRRAFEVLLTNTRDDPAGARRFSRMLSGTPSLRARHLEKQLAWQEELVPEIRRRLGASADAGDPRANALVASALSCLDAATNAWAEGDPARDIGPILDSAIESVQQR